MGDHNTQKMITFNETHLTLAISNLIISEGLSFNISKKTTFKKVFALSRNVSKGYQPPNRNIIPKDLLDVIHDQIMERNLIFIL